MIRIASITILGALAALPLAAAASGAHPPGALLGAGPVTHPQTIYSAGMNPAAGAAAERRGFRAGLFTFGLGYELGKADDFQDRFDDMGDDIDGLENISEDLQKAVEGIDLTSPPTKPPQDLLDPVADVHGVEDRTDETLEALADDGYLVLSFNAQAPLMPMVLDYDFLGGALTLDAGASLRGRLGLLYNEDNPFQTAFHGMPTDPNDWDDWDGGNNWWQSTDGNWRVGDDGSGEVVIRRRNADGVWEDLGTEIEPPEDTGVILETAQVTRFSLGYSGRTYAHRDGTLYAGGRLNHYDVRLNRVATFFDEDADDTFSDRYDENEKQTIGMGLDLGLIWRARNFMAGMTVRNVNEPSFDYKSIPQRSQCGDDKGCRLLNRYVENGVIERSPTWTMERQINVEGSVYNASRQWVIAFSYDLNEVEGPLDSPRYDDGHQWMTLSAAYASRNYVIPGFRLGYRSNQAGEELTYYTAGLTLFRHLTIDAALSTDKVTSGGGSTPRSAVFNIGLELKY